MSMSPRRRIEELERRAAGHAGPCPACGGDADRDFCRSVVVTEPPDAHDGPPPDLSPCPVCGRGPMVVRIVYVPTPLPSHLAEAP